MLIVAMLTLSAFCFFEALRATIGAKGPDDE